MPDLTSEELERVTNEVALGIPLERSQVADTPEHRRYRERVYRDIQEIKADGYTVDLDGAEFPS